MIRRPPRSTLFPLHDALPILAEAKETAKTRSKPTARRMGFPFGGDDGVAAGRSVPGHRAGAVRRAHASFDPFTSGAHTSELQSRQYLACRPPLAKTTHTPLSS